MKENKEELLLRIYFKIRNISHSKKAGCLEGFRTMNVS